MSARDREQKLPPLSGASAEQTDKLRVAVNDMKGRATKDTSPKSLRRELARMSPRLETIGRELVLVRKLIPVDLRATIAELAEEVAQLAQIIPDVTTFGPGDDSSAVAAELDAIEQRMMVEMSNAVGPSDDLIETAGVRPIADVVCKEHVRQLHAIEKRICQHQQRREKRISDIMQTMAKLAQPAPEIESISRLEKKVAARQHEVVSAHALVEEIKTSIDVIPAPAPATATDEVEAREAADISVPDVSADVYTTKDAIDMFREELQTTIQAMNVRADVCEEQARRASSAERELVDAASELAARVDETEVTCQALVSQMQKVAERLGDDSNKKMIQALTGQLKISQSSLKADIAAARTRIRKCKEITVA